METEQGKQEKEIEETELEESEDWGYDFLDDLSSNYADPFRQTQNWNL